MVTDLRLSKLASGLSAREAADAYALSRTSPTTTLGDAQRAQAAEFEATIEAMFLMAAVDGDVTGEELAQLSASVQAIVDTGPAGVPKQHFDMARVLVEMNQKLASEGWKGRLDAVAARLQTPEARAFAFRLAAGVAFVDDHVAHAEAAAIDALAAALRISSADSQEILSDVQETLFG